MPAPLWAEAVALARKQGLYITARGLHIDYGTLKWRLEHSPERTAGPKPAPAERPAPGGKPASGAKPAPGAKLAAKAVERPQFVELAPPLTFPAGAGARVEVVRRDGAKLAIQLRAGEALDVVGLVREFWGTRP